MGSPASADGSSSPSEASTTTNNHDFTFSSKTGLSFCSRIIQKHAPYIPHDYILEGVAASLNRKDLVAATPTGSRKTGYMAFFLIVAKELAENPTGYIEIPPSVRKWIPKHPLMLVVCPTDYMEYQLEQNFAVLSLKTLVINATTTRAANEAGSSTLWTRAQEDSQVSALLLSLEQLQNKEFEHALKNPRFRARIFALSVDEVHLLLSWGKKFWKTFQQIGLARSRLCDEVVIQALTATLKGDEALKAISLSLSLYSQKTHIIRRSNQHHDIQLIFREISSSIQGRNFPELDAILDSNRTSIIFCRTINLSHRVREYLYYWDKARGGDPSSFTERVREYNSLSESQNWRTRDLIQAGKCLIVLATSTLAMGVDVDKVEDVYIFGEPEDADEALQMLGRIRPKRDSSASALGGAWGIIFLLSNSKTRAEVALSNAATGSTVKDTMSSGSNASMDPGLATLILVKCKVAAIDNLYDNPLTDIPCTCPTCTNCPPTKRLEACNCSGCTPEDSIVPVKKNNKTSASPSYAIKLPKQHKRLSQALRAHDTRELKAFHMELFRKADPHTSAFLPPELFFTNQEIKLVLDYFSSIKKSDHVRSLMKGNRHFAGSEQLLWARLCRLEGEFIVVKEEEKKRKAEEKKRKANETEGKEEDKNRRTTDEA